MAIIAYVATAPAVSPSFELVFTVHFFDDNDPLNVGISQAKPPPVVVRTESWPFPATLTGFALQQALRDVILTRGALLIRARAAAADAANLLPVGSLVAIPGS